MISPQEPGIPKEHYEWTPTPKPSPIPTTNTYDPNATYDYWRAKIGDEIAREIRSHIQTEIEADGSVDWDQFSGNGWLTFAANIAEGKPKK